LDEVGERAGGVLCVVCACWCVGVWLCGLCCCVGGMCCMDCMSSLLRRRSMRSCLLQSPRPPCHALKSTFNLFNNRCRLAFVSAIYPPPPAPTTPAAAAVASMLGRRTTGASTGGGSGLERLVAAEAAVDLGGAEGAVLCSSSSEEEGSLCRLFTVRPTGGLTGLGVSSEERAGAAECG
jgi:hypothetical protein